MLQLTSTITLPTWVTLSRLVAVPVILGILSWQDSELSRAIALVAFLIAALTDWLDGYLARKLNQVTDLGKFLDPLVDKLLVLAPLLLLVQLGQVPAWGVFLIVAREMVITAWRGAPSSSQSSSQNSPAQPQIVGANLWGKAKTVVQILAIAWLIVRLPFAIWLFWLAVALTLISGFIYILPSKQEA
ncbi:CDP-diacylglycerol--glycerol-3-phosphate 3-phosphatidyltransferase [Tumidithrix elongata RA019]|uniref:CDP-diacylglycerol--glycerol-3-phosphate 3-phosphatidyltransferase n=1 Tax=Tumidithrix elongata BACA0141 TaxID=2716417 RepID=A0AAW9PU52_9CYAN|nr:CDP-diacylglycerol--glycerol-3-phosphate 3-phosphatidyltransferase [Tumidithrix elongata RA019]